MRILLPQRKDSGVFRLLHALKKKYFFADLPFFKSQMTPIISFAEHDRYTAFQNPQGEYSRKMNYIHTSTH
jgi:hypothetical protein